MSIDLINDPFCPESDPDYEAFSLEHNTTTPLNTKSECHCTGRNNRISRRSALQGISALTMIPITATAEPLLLPCKQPSQRVRPCHHKFCKHFGGGEDYYER